MNTIAQKEAFRNLSIKAYRAGARGVVFYPAPRVFVTSVPKAGSHLLITLLRRLPRMMFSGVHHAPRDFRTLPAARNGSDARPEMDWGRVRRVLESIRNGQFITVPGGTLQGVAVDSSFVYWTDAAHSSIGRVPSSSSGVATTAWPRKLPYRPE